MRIECARLPGNGINHMRVTMPDMRHIVVHVEVALAVRIEQPDALTLHQVQGLIIEKPIGRAHSLLPPLQQICCAFFHGNADYRRSPGMTHKLSFMKSINKI
jgi:hypothetical protein